MVKVVDYEDAAANPNEAYIYADLRAMNGIGASPVDETDTDAAKLRTEMAEMEGRMETLIRELIAQHSHE